MTDYAAHEMAATRDCKIGDCTNEAPKRGRYAGLCGQHRPGGGAYAPRPDQEIVVATPLLPPARLGPPVSVKVAAQKLVPVAGKLDAALTRKRTAHADAKAVFAEFKVAFEEIQSAAREALG